MSLNIYEFKRGLVTTLSITYKPKNVRHNETLSKTFDIDDTVEVWFRIVEYYNNKDLLYILVQSHESALKCTVKLNVICNQLSFSKQLTCPQYRGLLLGEFNFGSSSKLDIKLMASRTEPITFPKLYEDTYFTDFYLSSEKGRVAVHRTCLAAHSDMFKTMLLGKWKETDEGRVELKGLTLQTLQQLKEYMYLGTLPEDVRQLLLLARCYLLQNLKEDCMVQLAWTASSANFYELHDFAIENGLPDLTRLLLQVATNEVIDGAHQIEKRAASNINVDDYY